MKIDFARSTLHVLPADYSFLDQAAAEAREASRKYWVKGGAADTEYPPQPMPWWPPPSAPAPGTDSAQDRHNRRRHRQGKL